MSAYQRAISIGDLRRLARRRLPRFMFDYVDGGAEDECALRANGAAFERLRFAPRVMRDVSRRELSSAVLGGPAALPVAVGPTGLAGLCWRNGDLALARAARAAGVPFVLSSASMVALERVALEAGGRLWFQAYVFRNRAVTDALIRRAQAAGYETLVITCDFPVPGKRERDWRNGLTTPPHLTLGSLLNIVLHPRWIATVASSRPRFESLAQELPAGEDDGAFVSTQIDPALNWDDFRRFREQWRGKLLLKGVLRAEDAERAVALGADGVVLSNHGGRQLDTAVTALEVLPEVVRALSGRAAVLVDGGVRRGSDIAKAVALGAQGVLLGRSALYGLAAGGEAGVAKALDILRDELDRTLALTGCTRLADLERALLWPDGGMRAALAATDVQSLKGAAS